VGIGNDVTTSLRSIFHNCIAHWENSPEQPRDCPRGTHLADPVPSIAIVGGMDAAIDNAIGALGSIEPTAPTRADSSTATIDL